MTNLSFLYYGNDQIAYEVFLLVGLIICLISTFFIIFKKDTLRNKFLWTTIKVFLALAEQRFEPIIIKQSFKKFIIDNQSSLTVANRLLTQKKTEIAIYQDSYIWFFDELNDNESKILRDTLDLEKIAFIHKDQEKIYYCTFSRIDLQKGVYYFLAPQKFDKKYKHIFGQWYY